MRLICFEQRRPPRPEVASPLAARSRTCSEICLRRYVGLTHGHDRCIDHDHDRQNWQSRRPGSYPRSCHQPTGSGNRRLRKPYGRGRPSDLGIVRAGRPAEHGTHPARASAGALEVRRSRRILRLADAGHQSSTDVQCRPLFPASSRRRRARDELDSGRVVPPPVSAGTVSDLAVSFASGAARTAVSDPSWLSRAVLRNGAVCCQPCHCSSSLLLSSVFLVPAEGFADRIGPRPLLRVGRAPGFHVPAQPFRGPFQRCDVAPVRVVFLAPGVPWGVLSAVPQAGFEPAPPQP